MLHNPVWASVSRTGERSLCLGCVEGAIGRRLRPDDFTDAVVNRWPAMSPGERQRSEHVTSSRYPLRNADVPRYWSTRFLDRLGVGNRYAYWINYPERANPTVPV